ncbi:hypothetical protein ACFWAT_05050 [Streptomyces syringium]|uniref:hypothetical protein n=1 Tax=Streptomyces syringium TaxID=76729 RepID=UPI0036508F64
MPEWFPAWAGGAIREPANLPGQRLDKAGQQAGHGFRGHVVLSPLGEHAALLGRFRVRRIPRM